MAQHIGCHLVDEHGNVVKDSGLNFALVLNILGEKEKYQWLHTIDAYGDTLFNPLQTPFIISELEKLKNELNQEMQNLITKFVELIKIIGMHQYIKFIGDKVLESDARIESEGKIFRKGLLRFF